MGTSVLVVDNYDSFVFTIVGYLTELGATCEVVRNDAVTVDAATGFDGVLLSPGPGTPQDAGICLDMVAACADRRQPLLGVCLGHQALGVAFAAVVDRAPELLHGKTSVIEHEGAGGAVEGLLLGLFREVGDGEDRDETRPSSIHENSGSSLSSS